MIRKASVLLLATLFITACATTDPNDPNAKAKRGAGAGKCRYNIGLAGV